MVWLIEKVDLMELTLLGTGGGPRPSSSRFPSSQAITIGDRCIVIDAGNGVGQQMVRAGLNPDQMSDLLITHLHVDHCADLGVLPITAWVCGRSETMRIVGPPPTAKNLADLIDGYGEDLIHRTASTGRPDFRQLVQVRDIYSAGVFYEDDDVRLSAALVNHPPFTHALAFRIDTAEGSVVISGDTTPCPALIELARGATVLVNEVVHPTALDLLAAGSNASTIRKHMTDSHTMIEQVGVVAQEAGVGTLVLSHLLPHEGLSDEQWLTAMGDTFSGTTIVGKDLDRLLISSGEAQLFREKEGSYV